MAYIRELEQKIHDYLWQESCTPEQFAAKEKNNDRDEWQRAWDCWEQWIGEAWKDVAIAHAGRPLTDSEFRTSYGEWKDRESEPGKKLLRIIKKDERPEKAE